MSEQATTSLPRRSITIIRFRFSVLLPYTFSLNDCGRGSGQLLQPSAAYEANSLVMQHHSADNLCSGDRLVPAPTRCCALSCRREISLPVPRDFDRNERWT